MDRTARPLCFFLPCVIIASLVAAGCSQGVPVGLNVIQTGLSEYSSIQSLPVQVLSGFDQNLSSEVLSLSYLIASVEFCAGGGAPDGLNYEPSGGCAVVYEADVAKEIHYIDASSITGAVSTEFMSGRPAALVDFMNPTSLRKLNTPAEIEAGSYAWAVTRFYPAALLKAEIAVGAGGTVVTRSGGSISGAVGSAANTVTSSMLGATAEEGFMPLPVNAVAVRLITPWTVLDTDTGYVVDLTFDPTGMIGACTGCNAGNMRDGSRGIHLSPLDLMPVPRRTGFFTRRERYLVTMSADLKMRVDIYYSGDDKTKIASVSTRVFFDENSSTAPLGGTDACRVTSVSIKDDGTLRMGNDMVGNIVNGLRREASGTVNLEATASCGGQFSGASYTYLGTQELRSSL